MSWKQLNSPGCSEIQEVTHTAQSNFSVLNSAKQMPLLNEVLFLILCDCLWTTFLSSLCSSFLSLGHAACPVHTLATSQRCPDRSARMTWTHLICFSMLPFSGKVRWSAHRACCIKNGVYPKCSSVLQEELYLNYLHRLNFISENYYEALRALSRTNRIIRLHIIF